MREVLDFIELKAAGELPSPKGVALKVMRLCQDENLSLKELATTIQADPALAGRLIKIANYVNPNRSRPIASVTTDTLILIGIHAVRQVVMGLSLIGNYRDGRCKLFDYDQFWSHSVAMGSAAHAIATVTRVTSPAEMFNCGLMSGVGQLALVTARPESYCELLAEFPEASTKILYDAQQQHFGTTQREMMIFMLQDWGIPKLFIDALYYHEDPLSSGYAENSRPLRLTYTLQLAALLARACMQSEIDDALLSRIQAFGALLGIDPEQLDDIAEKSMAEWRDWCSILNVSTTIKPAPEKPTTDQVPEAEAPAMPEPLVEATTLDAAAEIMPLRILIVSGNELQNNLLTKIFTSGGHTINVAPNGPKALELLGEFKPHAVVADWMLHEMDCLSFCRALRKDAWGEKLYLIVVTQFEDERHKIDAFEAGADVLMRTPLNPRLLNAQLIAAQRFAKLHGTA
jgi:HD-like signal output (HDOD) protein